MKIKNIFLAASLCVSPLLSGMAQATPVVEDLLRSPRDILCDIVAIEPGLAMVHVETANNVNPIIFDGHNYIDGKIPVQTALKMYQDFLNNNGEANFPVEKELADLFHELLNVLNDSSQQIYTCQHTIPALS